VWTNATFFTLNFIPNSAVASFNYETNLVGLDFCANNEYNTAGIFKGALTCNMY